MFRRDFFAALAAPLLAKFIPDGKHFPKEERTHQYIHYVMRVPAPKWTLFCDSPNYGDVLTPEVGDVMVPSQTGDIWKPVEMLKPYGKYIHIVEYPKNIYGVAISNDRLTIKCKMKDMSYVNVSGSYV